MAQGSTLRFVHRPNKDGTIDSICRDCYVTVATARRELELWRAECDHVCDPALLEYYEESSDRSKTLLPAGDQSNK